MGKDQYITNSMKMKYDVLYNFISPVTGKVIAPNVAPSDATYILQTPNAALPNAQALDSLGNGILFKENGGILITKGKIDRSNLPYLTKNKVWIGDSENIAVEDSLNSLIRSIINSLITSGVSSGIGAFLNNILGFPGLNLLRALATVAAIEAFSNGSTSSSFITTNQMAINVNMDMQGNRITNLSSSILADSDAVSAKWVWDLINNKVLINSMGLSHLVVGNIHPELYILGSTQQFIFNQNLSTFRLNNTFSPTNYISNQTLFEFRNNLFSGYRWIHNTNNIDTYGSLTLQSFVNASNTGTNLLNFSSLGIGTFAPLQFYNSLGTHYVALQAGTLTSNTTWTLPTTDGSSGQALITNGSGVLSWSSTGVGSVTNVGTGAGLTGGPITTSGTISLVTPVSITNGGTGITSATAYAVLCGGTTSTSAFQSVSGLGTTGQVLMSNGTGALPSWQTPLPGTVSSISQGANIVCTPNPITLTGTVALSNTLSGLTSIGVGSFSLSGNTISSANTNGDINISPNGSGIFFVNAGPIGSAQWSNQPIFFGNSNSGNLDILKLINVRYTPGSNWTSSEIRLQKIVDATYQHYISFRGNSGFLSTIVFGYGGLTSGTELAALSQDGKFTIGSTTTTSLFNVGSAAQFQINGSGIVVSGTWNGSILTVPYGGTGNSSATAYALLCGGTTSTGAFQSVGSLGTSGQVLISQGAGALPTWTSLSSFGVTSIIGTANQVLANNTSGSSQLGAVTLTLPQSIATTSTVQFGSLGLNGIASASILEVVNGSAQIGFSSGTSAPTNGLAVNGQSVFGSSSPTIGALVSLTPSSSYYTALQIGGSLSLLKPLAPSTIATHIAATSSLIGNVALSYFFSIVSTPTISLGTNVTGENYGFYYSPTISTSGSNYTLAKSYGIYSAAGSLTGGGSVTNAYGAYISKPSFGSTSSVALYADNASIGYTGINPPTNGLIVSGNVSIGNSSPNSYTKLDVNGTIASEIQLGFAWLGDISSARWYSTLGGYNLSFYQDNSSGYNFGNVSNFGTTWYQKVVFGTSSVAFANNMGIGISTPTCTLNVYNASSQSAGGAMSSTFRVEAPRLTSTSGNEVNIASFITQAATSNSTALGISAYRNTTGSDWTTESIILGMDVDNTKRAGSWLALYQTGIGFNAIDNGTAYRFYVANANNVYGMLVNGTLSPAFNAVGITSNNYLSPTVKASVYGLTSQCAYNTPSAGMYAAYGLYIGPTGITGDGTIDNIFGIHVGDGSVSGPTVGVGYGIFVSSVGYSDTCYGLYVSDVGIVSNKYCAYFGGRVGIKTNPIYTLHLGTDDAYKTTTSSWGTTSDKRIKKNIKSIEKAIPLLKEIRPVSFQYTQEYCKDIEADEETINYGFIADEIENVIPNCVNDSKLHCYGMKYNGVDKEGKHKPEPPRLVENLKTFNMHNVIIFTIKAVQELIEQNEFLQTRVDILESKLSIETKNTQYN